MGAICMRNLVVLVDNVSTLSRRAFRNELFKKFEQISLHKPLVYFLDFRDTLF